MYIFFNILFSVSTLIITTFFRATTFNIIVLYVTTFNATVVYVTTFNVTSLFHYILFCNGMSSLPPSLPPSLSQAHAHGGAAAGRLRGW